MESKSTSPELFCLVLSSRISCYIFYSASGKSLHLLSLTYNDMIDWRGKIVFLCISLIDLLSVIICSLWSCFVFCIIFAADWKIKYRMCWLKDIQSNRLARLYDLCCIIYCTINNLPVLVDSLSTHCLPWVAVQKALNTVRGEKWWK